MSVVAASQQLHFDASKLTFGLWAITIEAGSTASDMIPCQSRDDYPNMSWLCRDRSLSQCRFHEKGR
jgi:hypothetical protein